MTKVAFSPKPGISETEVAALIAAASKGGLSIFGDGSDGDITVNANPFTSGTLIVNNELKRDAFFNDLTINDTRILETNGYRVFVKGTLTNNGTIHRNGNNGANGTGDGGGAGGAALSAAALGSSGIGGDGGTAAAGRYVAGGGGSGGGIEVIVARIIVNGSGVISVNGGDGGDGFEGSNTGGEVGGAGGSQGPSLGGAGGAGGATGETDGGAAGTITTAKSGGRSLPVAISGWETQGTPSRIKGGGGGGGGSIKDGTNGAGGGGGGGGGCLVLIYNSLTVGTEQATAGTAGVGVGLGDAGENGTAGRVIKIANA